MATGGLVRSLAAYQEAAVTYGITAAEAATILARNMRAVLGVPEPAPRLLELVGRCPWCGMTALHYLGERGAAARSPEGGTIGPTVDRECMRCGHTWEEMLDA